MLQTRSVGNVGEATVAIILEEAAVGLLAGRKSFEPPAVHQENIQPAVIVVIVECKATAGGLKKILVLALASIDGLVGQSGLFHHVHKAESERRAFYRRLRTGWRSLGLGVITALNRPGQFLRSG